MEVTVLLELTEFNSNTGNVHSGRTFRGIYFKTQSGMEIFVSGSQVGEENNMLSGLSDCLLLL